MKYYLFLMLRAFYGIATIVLLPLGFGWLDASLSNLLLICLMWIVSVYAWWFYHDEICEMKQNLNNEKKIF
jgi:hypothetical protein